MAPTQHQASGFRRRLPTTLLNLWWWVFLSHALGIYPGGLQMTMAEQGGGKGWRSSALTLPAQPPASWRTSERTFVWAAKLNLPPSCQGIGKAVRGEEKGERGGRSSGRDGGREAGRQAGEQALGAPVTQALPALEAGGSQGGAAATLDTQAGARPPGLGGLAPGASGPGPAPGEWPSLCAPRESRGGKGSRGRKVWGR